MTLKLIIGALLLLLIGTGLYHSYKPLPPGVRHQGQPQLAQDPVFLVDQTFHEDEASTPRLEQEIFPEIQRLIGQARRFVLVDMFLFNSTGPEGVSHQPLARQLTEALIARKQAVEDIRIVVISDPINTLYGGLKSPWFEQLRAAGITVVETRLTALRDSNPAWSAFWRLCCQWFGNSPESGWLPNPLGGQPVTLRSYLALLNFKANHRKLLVVDEGEKLRGLVTSANPHDGSSHHGNTALTFTGPAVLDLLRSERGVLAFSGADTSAIDALLAEPPTGLPAGATDVDGSLSVVTESAILDTALDMIRNAPSGSNLDLAIFYLSHREIITALKAARQRDVSVRVLLDANNEAFGRDKSGVPNRQVAMEMVSAGVEVRWCLTRGEQCHSKLLIWRDNHGSARLLQGSANFTRRNLDDLNLETNVHLQTTADSPVIRKATRFFEAQWNQGPEANPVRSLPYQALADESTLRYWQYRFMEATGMSTF